MKPAPFLNDLAEGPEGTEAFWRQSSDGLRLRVTIWPKAEARGTILLFTGRTEYAEKYGRIAHPLTDAGYAIATVDWRGQGMSDRVAKDVRLGHVGGFPHYQRDVAELVATARERDLPRPWYLIAHSMGGCIGLRALIEGLPVERALFSAPMWGIKLPPMARPLPYFVPQLLRPFGLDTVFAPQTGPENYVVATDFTENMLTTDRETYDYLHNHAEARAVFALGGPSLAWVGRATYDCRWLARQVRPGLAVLTFLGGEEDIVSTSAIHAMHADWPSGELRIIPGARHEIMMEAPNFKARFLDEGLAFLAESHR